MSVARVMFQAAPMAFPSAISVWRFISVSPGLGITMQACLAAALPLLNGIGQKLPKTTPGDRLYEQIKFTAGRLVTTTFIVAAAFTLESPILRILIALGLIEIFNSIGQIHEQCDKLVNENQKEQIAHRFKQINTLLAVTAWMSVGYLVVPVVHVVALQVFHAINT